MKPGSKVVCIDASIPPHAAEEIAASFTNWVVQDTTYTIREILDNNGIVTSVLLEELVNPILFFKKTINRAQEASFRITRFRELEPPEEETITETIEECITI